MGFDYRSSQWAAPSEEESAQASTRRRLLVLDPKPLPGAVQLAPGEGAPEQPRP
jgi:hypothetical protein